MNFWRILNEVRVIAWRRLREYADAGHGDAGEALREWYRVAENAEWNRLADVRRDYPTADLVGDRLVFNIRGNKYRLVCKIRFGHPMLFVRWVGTHAEYDRIDVRNI